MVALSNSSKTITPKLMQAVLDKTPSEVVGYQTKSDLTALIFALENKSKTVTPEVMQAVLDKTPSEVVGYATKAGWTALMDALLNTSETVTPALMLATLNKTPDAAMGSHTEDGWTALTFAVDYSNHIPPHIIHAVLNRTPSRAFDVYDDLGSSALAKVLANTSRAFPNDIVLKILNMSSDETVIRMISDGRIPLQVALVNKKIEDGILLVLLKRTPSRLFTRKIVDLFSGRLNTFNPGTKDELYAAFLGKIAEAMPLI